MPSAGSPMIVGPSLAVPKPAGCASHAKVAPMPDGRHMPVKSGLPSFMRGMGVFFSASLRAAAASLARSRPPWTCAGSGATPNTANSAKASVMAARVFTVLLLRDHERCVPIPLPRRRHAGVFEHLVALIFKKAHVALPLQRHPHLPGPGKDVRVVDRHLVVERVGVDERIALLHLGGFAMEVARHVEPGMVAEVRHLHDEGVAFPAAA